MQKTIINSQRRLLKLLMLVTVVLLLSSVSSCQKWQQQEPEFTKEEVISEMRRYAEMAVRDAKSGYEIDLDYSPESVEHVEQILSGLHEIHATDTLAESELNRHSLKWGAYVGEVTKRMHECEWALDSEMGGEKSFPLIYHDRGESFPVQWCAKRIINGEEDNVWNKFQFLIINRDKEYLDLINTDAPEE